MIHEQAESILADFFAPLATDKFLGAIGQSWFSLKGRADHMRAKLFGADPKATVLGAFATHAEKLDCHSPAPTGSAPALRPAASSADFQAIVNSFHRRGYTLRIPDMVELTPELQRFVRAMELVLRQPVKASLFWSAAGAKAIIHYDKPHNIIVPLLGRKRWFISTNPPGLQNKWAQVGEPPPHLQRHQVLDVEPGDLIYIPGGTPHTVDSTTESLHLAIVFEPITLREAIIAAVDLLSDNDRDFRQAIIGRADEIDPAALGKLVGSGLDRLRDHCQSADFVRAAMDLRASRATADLPPLAKAAAAPNLTRGSRVQHSPLAIGHLRHSAGSLDFSQPGEHIAVHAGVEPELRYIAQTPAFRIADLPGAAGDDVKIALVSRLVQSGFLEVVG